MSEIEALHLACAFDMKIPLPRRAEVQRLVAAVNEQLWVGHFDLWTHTGMIMHRQALVLPGGLTASTAQCESMLVGAIHACERYYPAFQFVVWAGKSAAEAMARRCSTPRARRSGARHILSSPPPSAQLRTGAWAHTAVTSVSGKLLVPTFRVSLKPTVVMGPRLRGDDTSICCDSFHITNALQDITGTIALAGAGKMGGAMLAGWLARGLDPSRVVVIEPSPSARHQRAGRAGVHAQPPVTEAGAADTLVVAVKPQMFREAGAR